jgi:high-affinity Fe2+/Pb2+ permease
MKPKFVYIVGGIVLFSSISKVLGDDFQTNRQALIAGVLSAIAIGVMCAEYFSKNKLKIK